MLKGVDLTIQMEEWDKQLHRSQQNMRELAGNDPNTVLDTDFDLAAFERDTQHETTSQAPGMLSHDFSGVITKLDSQGGEDCLELKGQRAAHCHGKGTSILEDMQNY